MQRFATDVNMLRLNRDRILEHRDNRWMKIVIVSAVFLLLIIFCVQVLTAAKRAPTLLSSNGYDEDEEISYDFPFISRVLWNARPPKQKLPLRSPVPIVVIHHSFIPPVCNDTAQCCNAMRGMQNFHMDDRGWWDIGYNFAVGGDGYAYEGRGWEFLGAHALHYNNVSIGICLIGDWSNTLPPSQQLKTAQALIEAGVAMGYIDGNYTLFGHTQLGSTGCPGRALFEEIKKWEHFPASVDDFKKLN